VQQRSDLLDRQARATTDTPLLPAPTGLLPTTLDANSPGRHRTRCLNAGGSSDSDERSCSPLRDRRSDLLEFFRV